MSTIPEILETAFTAVLRGETTTIRFSTHAEAVRWRQQANKFRRAERERNERLPADSPMWGRTPYDDMEFGLEHCAVIIRPKLIVPVSIETSSE